MDWVLLPPISLTTQGDYLSLELTEQAGRLHVLLPGFELETDERLEVGLFGGTKSDPRLVGIQSARVSQFARYLYFDFPPALPGPLLGLRRLVQGGGALTVQPQYVVTSTESIMAFYDMQLTQLAASVDAELAQRIVTVQEIPDHRDYDQGDQVLFAGTGEVLTLGSSNRWVGDLQEESWSVIAPGVDDLEAGGSAALDAAAYYDFNGGPERFIEELLLSNASTQTATYDMVVPGFDSEVFVFEQLGVRSAMSLEIKKYTFQLNAPEIHVAAADDSHRASLLVRYRNAYEYVEPEQEAPGNTPNAA